MVERIGLLRCRLAAGRQVQHGLITAREFCIDPVYGGLIEIRKTLYALCCREVQSDAARRVQVSDRENDRLAPRLSAILITPMAGIASTRIDSPVGARKDMCVRP